MIAEIGHYAVILTLSLTVLQLLITWRVRDTTAASILVSRISVTHFSLMLIGFVALIYAFARNDFSVAYVANNSNLQLPLMYRVSAVWGAHEGSLVLWLLLMSAWAALFARYALRRLPADMQLCSTAVLSVLISGFSVFMLLTSNPFSRLLPIPADGNELNPLLQDPGLIFHPPLLYAGYVGFSVVFALAVAALYTKRFDNALFMHMRPWAVGAWLFLTLGITLGSFWAYYELGWGGWWFWDPVENASFMPWLTGTALIHTLSVASTRHTLKQWSLLLAILSFSLSMLGTFLVRSGVLTSVHSFAADPSRGIFILALFAIVLLSALILFTFRRHAITSDGRFHWLSRESSIVIGAIFITAACIAVLLGTLYPIILSAFDLGRISIGEPYFQRVFVPLMVPVVLLMGIGPFLKWQQHYWQRADTIRLLIAATIAVIGAALGVLLTGRPAIGAGIALTLWLIALMVSGGILHQRQGRKLTAAYIGMHIAHFGIALFIIGAVFTNTLGIERDAPLSVGESFTFGNHTFTLQSLHHTTGSNFDADEAIVALTYHDSNKTVLLMPQKRRYATSMPMTETAIDSRFSGDTYVSMGERLAEDRYSFRFYDKPLIRWLWFGALLMALGGACTLFDRRYRRKTS